MHQTLTKGPESLRQRSQHPLEAARISGKYCPAVRRIGAKLPRAEFVALLEIVSISSEPPTNVLEGKMQCPR